MPENVFSYMTLDESEKHFESDIESYYLSHGFRRISPSSFDLDGMVFTDVLVEFLKSSQPREWARYEKYYGASAPEKLVRRLNEAVSSLGILYVLKEGLDDMGIKLKLCYFKPESDLNAVLVSQYQKNIYGVTRQFRYSKKNTNTIDMVLSINGIPVFAFELKNQLKNQDVQCAIRQWKEDRDPKEQIFHFNTRFLSYFAVDLYDVYMTTELKGENTHFLPFNQGSNGAGNPGGAGNPANPNGYTTSYLWERVFSYDSMMDLIAKFITVVNKDNYVNGRLVKTKSLIFPRFHQYDAVHKIIDDVKEKGAGHNYLIEHSAGSGKSNSIAWIAYRLASAFDQHDEPIFSSVIVVTNRIVLDSQLQDTIKSFESKPGLLECITQKKGSRGLIEAINDKKRIIICTIQKFLFSYQEFDKIHNRNFAVIIDEAHQGQSGESARTLRKSLTDLDAEYKKYLEESGLSEDDIDESDDLMQEILAQGHHDNQSFFAFTATPISKTLQVFGTEGADGKYHPFHTYSMKQAIDEGYILDVLKDYMTIHQAFQLIKSGEDNPTLLEAKTKKALYEYYKNHDFTINRKVEIIMQNFLQNGRKKIDGHGKAMIVCDSRHSAVEFYFAIKDYIKSHAAECVGCNVLIAFSGAVKLDNDPTEYIEAKMNKDADGHEINSDKKFRQAFHSDQFNIMVVANKYQTGYDEPYLHSMYVDKKLKGVNAVQTLSRLNRPCPGKTDTFVLDFVNTADEIKAAFEPYYQETTLEGDASINRVYDLRRQLDTYSLFSGSEVDAFCEAMKSGFGKKQDATTIGKITSILKPVIDRYNDLDQKDRLLARDTMLKFSRFYSFITQLVRLDDKELFKDYLFISHLTHLLPKNQEEKIDISDKIQLQYASLKETFHGEIKLGATSAPFKPAGAAKPSARANKTDTLERIVDKVNKEFEGDFGPGDKVSVESVAKMMMDDKIIQSKLQKYAKTNDKKMFKESIFPDEFNRVLYKCYMQNDEAFKRLLNDSNFQQAVMNAMAEEMYRQFTTSSTDKNKEQK